MHRLLILTVMTLCFVGGLVAPAFATDYCPTVYVKAGKYCECIVWNYGAANDTNVTVFLSTPDGDVTCGPLTVSGGNFITCLEYLDSSGPCSCKVTGEGTYTRTSLVVDDLDWTPYVAVVCN